MRDRRGKGEGKTREDTNLLENGQMRDRRGKDEGQKKER